jgi:hypothetical protein
MRKGPAKSAYQPSLLQCAATISVAMEIPNSHPLLVLKRNLHWPAIREVVIKHLRQSGRNVDCGPGRPLDVDLYVPLLVLMVVVNKNSRQMEEYLGESAVARIFVDREQDPRFQVRDHSNIARMIDALGGEGMAELNGLIVQEAVKQGFADSAVLSADTTAQELPIGYPNEPGILKGLAQRCGRALRGLGRRGKRLLKSAQGRCQTIIAKAKEHHLFAKTTDRKKELLGQMVRETRRLVSAVEEVVARHQGDVSRGVRSAVGRLRGMLDVAKQLLPQIVYWMRTQRVAKGKILHSGLTEARAIVRNKAGKKVEFGLQYLLGVIGGGYIFAELIDKPTGETKMPERAIAGYRKVLGTQQAPEMFVYDRGGWSQDNVQKLKKDGVEKVGIQPRGRARWRVDAQDRQVVLSERGKTEGVIGNLKSDKYSFNKPKARRPDTLRAAGQKSVLSFNLNKYARDLLKSVPSQLQAANA